MIAPIIIPLLALAAALGSGAAAAGTPDALARHRWTSRLLVIAAEAGDPRLAAQRRIAGEAEAAFRERDLVVVEAVGDGGGRGGPPGPEPARARLPGGAGGQGWRAQARARRAHPGPAPVRDGGRDADAPAGNAAALTRAACLLAAIPPLPDRPA